MFKYKCYSVETYPMNMSGRRDDESAMDKKKLDILEWNLVFSFLVPTLKQKQLQYTKAIYRVSMSYYAWN